MICTFGPKDNDGVMSVLRGYDCTDNRINDLVLVEGELIELMPIESHWFLEASWTRWLVYLNHLLLLVYFKEGTDIMWLCDKQTRVVQAVLQREIALIVRRLERERRREERWLGLIDDEGGMGILPSLEGLYFWEELLIFVFKLLDSPILFMQCLLELSIVAL